MSDAPTQWLLVVRAMPPAWLLLGFCLVAAGTTAPADAWELWTREDYDAGLAGGWQVVAMFKDRRGCMEAMRRRFIQVSGGQPLSSRDLDRGAFLYVDRSYTSALSAKCVPDDWDPRGAKGK